MNIWRNWHKASEMHCKIFWMDKIRSYPDRKNHCLFQLGLLLV